MTTRISTGMLYQQSLTSMQSKQASMSRLQQQLASGQKLTTAKDDPVGAGSAVGLDRAVAQLERFGKNSDVVRHRLNMQENVLAQAGDMVGRIQTLTVQASTGTLSDGDRNAIAVEIRSLRDALFDLANTPDGAGRYLFGGTQDGNPPFARSGGSVVYGGDQIQRQVEIAPQMFAADAAPGSEVFLRVRTGDGRLDVGAAAANTGTGQIGGFALTDPAAWDGGRYRAVFDADGGYEILDAAGDVVSGGTYASGDVIAFNGVRVTLTGAPAEGDTFEIGPAGTRDIFATLDGMLQALTMQPTTDAGRAAQQNALRGAMRDVAMAENHFSYLRASGGAQLSALDEAGELRSALDVTLQTTLSGLRDLDYVDAISQFNVEKVALEAAQLSFVQMQRLSLFNLIR